MSSEFSFVFVPADVSMPLVEWTQEQPEGQEVECLTQRLQAHFRETTTTSAASKAALLTQLQSQLPAGTAVTDEMMEAVSAMQLVESLPLQSGRKVNGYVHVNLYCDDSGTAKGLPKNARASAISEQAGIPRSVNGDAFIGRLVDDGQDEFKRMDFKLSEVSADADWMQAARAHNLQKDADGQIDQMKQLAGPGAQVITPGSGGNSTEGVVMDEEVPEDHGSLTWTQDADEIEVRVLCPPTTKTKDISCKITAKMISLSIGTLDTPEVLGGKLYTQVDADDTNWSIENCGGDRLVRITMAKGQTGQSWDTLMQE